MAGKSDIQAGKAFVELYVKNSLLVKGLNEAKAQLQGLGKNVMAIGGVLMGMGTAIVTPLIGAVAAFTKIGSELNDVSERTGLAASSLAELDYAAKQGGASLNDVEKALKFMAKSGKDVTTFDQIAAQIAAIEDPTERAQAAIKNFGKAGTSLLPIINDLQALREEARQLGIVPTDEAVKMADAIGDAWDSVQAVVQATIFNIGAALAPVLLPALNAVKNIAAWFNRWAKTNGEIIRTVFLIGGGILAAGAAITALGGLIFGVGTAFGVVAGAITTVAGVLGGLLSPAALVVAAIVGGVAAWVLFTDSGKAALQGVIDFFMPMVNTIRTTLGGIGDALIGGDLQLAAQIAATGLQLVFQQAVDSITSLIGGTLGMVLGDLGTRIIQGDFAGAWQTVVTSMAALWGNFCQGIVKVFTAAAGAVLKAWQGTVKTIANGLIDASAAGGVTGKIASAILGVDMEAEKRKSDSLDRQRGLVPGNSFLDQAHSAVGQNVDAMAGPVDEFLQGMNQAAADKADAANNELEQQLGSGEGTSDAVKRLQEQLDELRRQAAAAKEAANKGSAAKAGTPDTSGLDEIKSKIEVGFSARGLLAQGGGPQERIARGVERLVESQERTNELLEQDDDVEVDA